MDSKAERPRSGENGDGGTFTIHTSTAGRHRHACQKRENGELSLGWRMDGCKNRRLTSQSVPRHRPQGYSSEGFRIVRIHSMFPRNISTPLLRGVTFSSPGFKKNRERFFLCDKSERYGQQLHLNRYGGLRRNHADRSLPYCPNLEGTHHERSCYPLKIVSILPPFVLCQGFSKPRLLSIFCIVLKRNVLQIFIVRWLSMTAR